MIGRALLSVALLAGFLSATNASAQSPPAERPGLARLLEVELADFPSRAGLYVKHLKTGEEISIRGDERFESASTIKLGILAYVYHLHEQGKLDLNERIELKQSDLVGGSGVLRYMGPGPNLSIRDLATEMVITSDNTATDMLLRKVGGIGQVNAYLNEAGFSGLKMNSTVAEYFTKTLVMLDPKYKSLSHEDLFALCCGTTTLPNVRPLTAAQKSLIQDFDRRFGSEQLDAQEVKQSEDERGWFGTITPAQMGGLLESIETCRIHKPESCDEMRRILLNTQSSGTPIAAALRIHVSRPVGHKTGTTGGVTNDIGIVYAKTGPIVIAFYNGKARVPLEDIELRMGRVAQMIVAYFDGP